MSSIRLKISACMEERYFSFELQQEIFVRVEEAIKMRDSSLLQGKIVLFKPDTLSTDVYNEDAVYAIMHNSGIDKVVSEEVCKFNALYEVLRSYLDVAVDQLWEELWKAYVSGSKEFAVENFIFSGKNYQKLFPRRKMLEILRDAKVPQVMGVMLV